MGQLVRTIGLVAVMVAALLGTGATGASASVADEVAAHRAFVQAGFSGSTDEEYLAWAQAVGRDPAGPSMRSSAARAVTGSVEELRAYVDGGYLSAWRVDERLRLLSLISTATEPNVDRELQLVLESNDTQVWSEFLDTGLAAAQYADDELAAARMLLGGPDSSGPALDAAAQVALEGTPAELREFIVTGQFVARALDAQAAAPVQPGAPAAPVPGAPAPAAPASAVAPRPAAGARVAGPGTPTVLAATGVAEGPTAALALAAILSGGGLVLLSRPRTA